MNWKPATVEAVKKIFQNDLADSDKQQAETFERYGVHPYFASILRNGNLDTVIVVARNGDEVIYWEDVEQGFNV